MDGVLLTTVLTVNTIINHLMTQQSFEGRTSSNSSEYGTPDEIYIPLDEEFHFEFDLAADPRNTKIPGRENFFTKEDDALSRSWPRKPCFLNPPYSRAVRRWIIKSREESILGTPVIVVINANTESQWYQHVAVPFAHEIRHLEHRQAFIDWEAIWRGEKTLEDKRNGSYHPTCVLVFKPDQSTIPQRRVVRIDGSYCYVIL